MNDKELRIFMCEERLKSSTVALWRYLATTKDFSMMYSEILMRNGYMNLEGLK